MQRTLIDLSEHERRGLQALASSAPSFLAEGREPDEQREREAL